MDYKKIYDKLIESRLNLKSERKNDKNNYYEKHHIIPISMGGSKSRCINSDNIVILTAREHYIAHRLLWLIYRNRKMALAFSRMLTSNKNQLRINNSRVYEIVRNALSESQMGNNNHMYGKVSIMKGKVGFNKGRKFGSRVCITGDNNPSKRIEVRNKISASLKGRKKTKEHIENMFKNRKYTKGPDNHSFGKFKSHYTNFIIYEYNKISGEFIRKWESIIEASDYYNINRKVIYSNLNNKIPSAYNSIWLYEYKGNFLKINYKICELNSENEIIKKWVYMSDLAKELNVCNSTITYIIKNNKLLNGRKFILYKN